MMVFVWQEAVTVMMVIVGQMLVEVVVCGGLGALDEEGEGLLEGDDLDLLE